MQPISKPDLRKITAPNHRIQDFIPSSVMSGRGMYIPDDDDGDDDNEDDDIDDDDDDGDVENDNDGDNDEVVIIIMNIMSVY